MGYKVVGTNKDDFSRRMLKRQDISPSEYELVPRWKKTGIAVRKSKGWNRRVINEKTVPRLDADANVTTFIQQAYDTCSTDVQGEGITFHVIDKATKKSVDGNTHMKNIRAKPENEREPTDMDGLVEFLDNLGLGEVSLGELGELHGVLQDLVGKELDALLVKYAKKMRRRRRHEDSSA
ncbi:hypothetical protein CNX70_18415 [Janthinobacterium svalbardensis]|uniref:Uncharacterized protein n=2 Tax=Janthinobacterium svalbardensis TaxID=368607 RepID=A0A290WZ80_9BURK|nr:hypothetical protein CNX70_18415 [Janthinobacterium svalbardensis]